MNRRSFLQSILAAGVAPYVVTTAGLLMPVKQIVRPTWRPYFEEFGGVQRDMDLLAMQIGERMALVKQLIFIGVMRGNDKSQIIFSDKSTEELRTIVSREASALKRMGLFGMNPS